MFIVISINCSTTPNIGNGHIRINRPIIVITVDNGIINKFEKIKVNDDGTESSIETKTYTSEKFEQPQN